MGGARAGALGPRLVVAGTHAGVGKTTVATGLMAAMAGRGVRVGAAKVGPDFVDPAYHRVATGRPGRNLDVFLSGSTAITGLAARAAAGSDLLVVEGVRGLFDGVGPTTQASTAQVAALLDAPVLLVVDASAVEGSVAALVRGHEETMRRALGRPIAGLVLNRVASDHHEATLRAALDALDPPVLGVVRRDPALVWRDRHLGLVPVLEGRGDVPAAVARLGEVMARSLDLGAIERVARAAPPAPVLPLTPTRRLGRVPIAVASGRAAGFAYEDNLERLAEAGAELLPFDPTAAHALPRAARGLYAGGAFPEAFAEALAANTPLLADVRRAVAAGLPTWAECGGLLWLCRAIDDLPLCGVVPAVASTGRTISVGYRTARVLGDTPVARAGELLRGHEVHHSSVWPPGDALLVAGVGEDAVEGFGAPGLLASYLHVHMGADPRPAERFVASALHARAAGSDAGDPRPAALPPDGRAPSPLPEASRERRGAPQALVEAPVV